VDPDDFAYGTIAGMLLDGKMYGVPTFTSTFALEMNPDVLEKSGLDRMAIPTTWAEILERAEKVYEAGGEGENWYGMTVWGPTPRRTYGALLRALPWLNRCGGFVGSDDGTEVSFDNPKAVLGYQLLYDFFKTTDPGVALGEDEGKVGGAVWNDLAAYQVSASWDAYSANDLNSNIHYAPVPNCDTADCAPRNCVVGNLTMSPCAGAANVPGGVAWVEFTGENETQWQLAKLRGWVLPARLDVLADPDVAKQPAYEGLEEQMAVFLNIVATEELHPVPPLRKNPARIWTLWSDHLGRILIEDADIATEMSLLQQEAEELME
jgi:ABC-type glycerol-3-phosphate transport system substrate-binding protein